MKTLDSWNRAGKVLANIDAQGTSNVSCCTEHFTGAGFCCCCCFPVPLPNDWQVWLIATKPFWQMPVTYSSTLNQQTCLQTRWEKGLGKLPEESPSCLLQADGNFLTGNFFYNLSHWTPLWTPQSPGRRRKEGIKEKWQCRVLSAEGTQSKASTR